MTRHQHSSGLGYVIGFSRFTSRQAAGLTLHKHLADDEVRVRDRVTTLFSSSPVESCGPATTETSREKTRKETRPKPLMLALLICCGI